MYKNCCFSFLSVGKIDHPPWLREPPNLSSSHAFSDCGLALTLHRGISYNLTSLTCRLSLNLLYFVETENSASSINLTDEFYVAGRDSILKESLGSKNVGLIFFIKSSIYKSLVKSCLPICKLPLLLCYTINLPPN